MMKNYIQQGGLAYYGVAEESEALKRGHLAGSLLTTYSFLYENPWVLDL